MTAAPLANGAPILEKYEVLEEIGHGGMATVYRARDPRLGREVAIKVIHKHLRENLEVATRFVAEARAAAKLHHRGIVEVFDVSSEDDAERFLVVELLRGTTLRKVVQKHRDMPAEVGAAIVLELCEALEHAHESGIIHRDVKPENVLVECPQDRAACRATPRPARKLAANDEGDGTHRVPDAPVSSTSAKKAAKPGDLGVVIKLTDFGIAKILDAQGVTSTGQVLGSPAHMAPEQIEGGDVDVRTDVFALGVLMYECLVGHLPFDGKNPAQVLRRVLDGVYAAADRERPTVGGRWAKIIAGALARDAADRTPSPNALAEQIRAELAELGVRDPRAAVNQFFADPAGYAEVLTKDLVPRLVARGEAARKGGDVPGAAADYNRALALAPNDLTILKRVTSLNSRESRRVLFRRAGVILGGTIVLGLSTFAVVRWIRARPHPETGPLIAERSAVAPPPSAPVASDSTANPPAAGSIASDSPRPRIKLNLSPLPSPAVVAAGAQSGTRMVSFVAIPSIASITVDGNSSTFGFGKSAQLGVGMHSVQVSVPKSKCCKAFSGSSEVKPPSPDKPDEVQSIKIKLDLNPSTVSLAGAPPGGAILCSRVGLSVMAGSTQTVTLPEAVWSGSCEFTRPDGPSRNRRITLNAGEQNPVEWPAD